MAAAQEEQLAAEATAGAILQAEVKGLRAQLSSSLEEMQVINNYVLVLMLFTCRLSMVFPCPQCLASTPHTAQASVFASA